MALEPGTRLGPYEIIELRGKGGMGEVYRARDTRLDRDVAIKVLLAELGEDQTYRHRLEREAKTIAQLQHPHVCTLYDIGSEGGIQYLAMEFLEGETLEDRLARGQVPVDEVVRIGSEIAEAVEAAHRAGVVHRDLKPGNVMLTAAGTKVLDFGLAREAPSPGGAVATRVTTARAITDEGTLVGTMPYMAPEQLEGRAADHRTDIWALGCILYEMATGERPFSGDTQASLIGAILKDEPEPPSRKRPLNPARLDWVVKRCLEKDPEKRWQSPRDVAIEIGALALPAEGEPRSDRSPTPPRHRRWVLGAAALIVLAVGLSFWLGTRTLPGDEYIENEANLSDQLLAVMPFDNLSTDPELDELALGIPTEVIARFGERWPVASRSTSFAYSEESACEAAREIPANAVMEGSVRRASGGLRVMVEIIGCPQEEPFWVRSFEGDATDLLGLQDEIAAQIVATSFGDLFQQQMNTTGSPYWHLARMTREHNETALGMLRRAAERQPSNEEWWIAINLATLQALTEGYTESISETVAENVRSAEECIRVRPKKWSCYQASMIAYRVTGESEKMVEAARRLVALSGDLTNDHFLGDALAIASLPDEALQILVQGAQANPDRCSRAIADAYFAAGRYEEAVDCAQRQIQRGRNSMHNDLASAHQMSAASYAQLGRLEEARAALAEAVRLRPRLKTHDSWRLAFSAADSDHQDRYFGGLRLAGLDD